MHVRWIKSTLNVLIALFHHSFTAAREPLQSINVSLMHVMCVLVNMFLHHTTNIWIACLFYNVFWFNYILEICIPTKFSINSPCSMLIAMLFSYCVSISLALPSFFVCFFQTWWIVDKKKCLELNFFLFLVDSNGAHFYSLLGEMWGWLDCFFNHIMYAGL